MTVWRINIKNLSAHFLLLSYEFCPVFLEFERSHFVLKNKVIYFTLLCKGLGNINLLNL